MDINTLNDYLSKNFNDSIELIDESYFKIKHEILLDFAKFIKEDKKLMFDYLMCISSYDVGDKKHYGVTYNLKSTHLNHYLEFRIEVDDETEIPSLTKLWGSADWHEREAYDMMGVKFSDHPNFKRILLPEDWDGYPLRKDFETPDYYRGMPVPKDKNVLGMMSNLDKSIIKAEEMVLNMGPQHPSTHGVLRLKIHTDGEVVSKIEPIMGYLL